MQDDYQFTETGEDMHAHAAAYEAEITARQEIMQEQFRAARARFAPVPLIKPDSAKIY